MHNDGLLRVTSQKDDLAAEGSKALRNGDPYHMSDSGLSAEGEFVLPVQIRVIQATKVIVIGIILSKIFPFETTFRIECQTQALFGTIPLNTIHI